MTFNQPVCTALEIEQPTEVTLFFCYLNIGLSFDSGTYGLQDLLQVSEVTEPRLQSVTVRTVRCIKTAILIFSPTYVFPTNI